MPDISDSTVFSPTDANNNKPTMPGWNGSAAPSTLDNAGRALQGAIRREWEYSRPTIATGGASSTFTATYTGGPTAYVDGQLFYVYVDHNGAGADTFNVNGIGAKAIKKYNGSATYIATVSGDLKIGHHALLTYNLSRDCFILENPAPLSTGIADATTAGRDMLTAATVAAQTALLDELVADTASVAGKKGLVPAPAAGTADANKALLSSGWGFPAQRVDYIHSNTAFGAVTVWTGTAGNFTQEYSTIRVQINGASHNNGASQTLQIEVWDGTTWGGPISIMQTAVAAAATYSGVVTIERGRSGVAVRLISAIGLSGTTVQAGCDVMSLSTTQVKNVRLSWTAGQFDAGTVYITGYP